MSYSIYDLHEDITDADLESFIDKLKLKFETHEYKANDWLIKLLQTIADHDNITLQEYIRRLLIQATDADTLIVSSTLNDIYITGDVNPTYKITLGETKNITINSEGNNA